MVSKIYTAPPNSGEVILGKTLPSLLDEACDRHPNLRALNQWTEKGWKPLSNQNFYTTSSEVARGLLELGLEKGDRVCLFMHSDVSFCVADMSCLMAGLIDVPIYLTQPPEAIVFIMQHAEAKTLLVSNRELLHKIAPYFIEVPAIKVVVVAEFELKDSESLPSMPPGVQLVALDKVRTIGAAMENQLPEIAPHDLATIVYTSGTTGQPKGVMLTHENISADILAAFTGIAEIQAGTQDVAISFLPLTHITARALFYGHLNYGHTIYFTTPDRAVEHLKEVQPTIFATVPRLLEKIYEKILGKGSQLRGFFKIAFDWALSLAKRYELGKEPTGLYALQLKIADRVVFSKWRAALGGRVKCLICGGAALNGEITNIFAAAGIKILQGYGLTESSSVICGNRGQYNRADTVGIPVAGVEMAIAPDGEILVRAPYITKGYYKNPEATREAIDDEGWFHTGDIGEFTESGFLKITDRKKNLFKLSTGKYVMPQPVESKLQQNPLVEHAVTIGSERKFCTLLIFPNLECLRSQTSQMGIELANENLLTHPKVIELYQALVNEANRALPSWSTVKRFKLISSALTVENGMLTPTLKVRRAKVEEIFSTEIDSLYSENEHRFIKAI